MRQRIRLTESDLHRIIRNCVNEAMDEGMMDKFKGAFHGMTNGFNKGNNQLYDDKIERERNKSASKNISRAVQNAYKTLMDGVDCKWNPRVTLEDKIDSLVDMIESAVGTLEYTLKYE